MSGHDRVIRRFAGECYVGHGPYELRRSHVGTWIWLNRAAVPCGKARTIGDYLPSTNAFRVSCLGCPAELLQPIVKATIDPQDGNANQSLPGVQWPRRRCGEMLLKTAASNVRFSVWAFDPKDALRTPETGCWTLTDETEYLG